MRGNIWTGKLLDKRNKRLPQSVRILTSDRNCVDHSLPEKGFYEKLRPDAL
jgi:hypothetical protein